MGNELSQANPDFWFIPESDSGRHGKIELHVQVDSLLGTDTHMSSMRSLHVKDHSSGHNIYVLKNWMW